MKLRREKKNIDQIRAPFYFQSQYCEELALMYVWQEDYDRARHYAASARELFLRVI